MEQMVPKRDFSTNKHNPGLYLKDEKERRKGKEEEERKGKTKTRGGD